MVVEMIWEFMKIKIRPRDDNIMDQYSRLFMMRLCLFCAAVAGISWSTDQFHCVVPGMYAIQAIISYINGPATTKSFYQKIWYRFQSWPQLGGMEGG